MQGDDDEDTFTDETSETTGTESEGAEGQDTTGGNEETPVSAQRTADEGDEGSPQEGAAPEHETQSRGRDRFRQLSSERNAAREDAQRARQELEEFKRQQWQRQQQLDEQQDQQRLALMTPEERADYRYTQFERRATQREQQHSMQMAAQMDKASYDAAAASNPVYRRMSAEVERKFQEQMAVGRPTDRVTILKYLIGESALNGAANQAPRRAAARRRIEGQQVKPARPSGDQAQSRKMSTAEDRLKDVLI